MSIETILEKMYYHALELAEYKQYGDEIRRRVTNAITIEITDVEGKMVHYILTAVDGNKKARHIAGVIEVGDDIPVSEMLDREVVKEA